MTKHRTPESLVPKNSKIEPLFLKHSLYTPPVRVEQGYAASPEDLFIREEEESRLDKIESRLKVLTTLETTVLVGLRCFTHASLSLKIGTTLRAVENAESRGKRKLLTNRLLITA